MTHISEGDLRAYLDHELDSDSAAHVETHVGRCGLCSTALATLNKRQAHLSALWADEDVAIPPMALARATVKSRPTLLVKENSMKLQRRFQWRYGALATAAILVVALLFPPVRAWAGELLGLFRVQKVTVLPVDFSQLNSGFSDDNQALITDVLVETMKSEPIGESQAVQSADEASKVSGFSVRLPGYFKDAPTVFNVNEGANVDMTLNIERLRALVATLGREDIQLPDSLNGAVIHVVLPQGVTTTYNECAERGTRNEPGENGIPIDCTTLIQIPSPTAETPADLDMNQIGQLFLQLLGMDSREAADFSQNLDWTSTLVLPIPQDEATYEDINVDGVDGTLIRARRQSTRGAYMLIWVKDGIIYGLNGNGSTSDAITIANSLQ